MASKRFYQRTRPRRATNSDVRAAVEHMRRRAMATETIHAEKSELDNAKLEGGRYQSAVYVERFTKFAATLFEAGRVSFDEYVFFASQPIEMHAEHLMMQDSHRNRFAAVEAEIEQIRKMHGLTDDEYWPTSEGPAEYEAANARWNQIAAAVLDETYDRFAPDELLSLRQSDREEFEATLERGRRSVFHVDDLVTATSDLILVYENESRACAGAGAYYAATAMLGAASEARLLLQCLTHRKLAAAAWDTLGKKKGGAESPAKWSLNQLIDVAANADWLPMLEDGELKHLVGGWVHHLRSLRNLLHPGRHVSDKPHIRIGLAEYTDARSAYVSLIDALRRANSSARQN